jgi:acyl carrier protein
MVPSAIVVLDSMPLTRSGKIDRSSLPPGGAGAGEAPAAFESPTPGTEQRLATLWQRMLQVERISRSDDFFRLGGHSLLAMRLIAHVRDEFAVELPLRAIFEQSVLAGLARAVDDLLPPAAGAIDPDEDREVLEF